MKKYISFLLCLIMILSLFSCGKENINQDTNKQDQNEITENVSNNVSNNTTVENYRSILEVYRLIVGKFPVVNQNPRAVAAELGIQDEAEIETFVDLYLSIHLFYPGSGEEDSVSPHHKLGCGYSIKDLNGDGVDELVLMNKDYYIMAIFSCSDGKSVLLGNYWDRNSCWIDGDGLLHQNGSNGADHSTHAIYKIADCGKELELIVEYGTNGHEWIKDVAYTIYYKLVDGEKTVITEAEYRDLDIKYGKYLGSVAGAEATKEYSGLTFTSLYTETEIAMEMYEAAIKGEICVFDEHFGEIKLKACRFPSNNLRLDECEILNKAILDMDGDGINEYVIQSEGKDHIVLRYYNGKVYSYCFDRSNFYNLNTDGSFYWSDSYESENWSRGLNQIAFDGSSLSIKEIYRIKHTRPFDIYNDHEFYVGGKQITGGEFSNYYRSNHHTVAIFSPLDISCEYPITSEKAYELASNHWGFESGMREGGAGTLIVHKIVILEKPNSDTLSYRICWQMEGYHNHIPDTTYSLPPYSVIPHKELFVDAITGECREYIDIEPDAKGYTEAEIAMEMYEAVLDNKVKIYNTNYTNNDKYVYLKDYKLYDISLSLCETKDLGYIYIDVNGDSVNELFIHHGEISIFWYHQGIVYGYSPSIANDDLNNDGSFSWRTYSANFGYGESKFVLNGSEIRTEVLWRIVNDGEPNAEYYIGEKQVTKEEILKYFDDNPKVKVEFLPLEVSWLNKVSRYEAITIAENYWGNFDIEENGYRVEHAVNDNAPDSVYVMVIKRFVIDHYSTFDEIWVDKNTGETIIPYAPDGKG